MRFLFTDGSRFEVVWPSDPVKEVAKAVKYFPNAVNLAVDCAMFSNIHCLHFYPHGPFSHRVDRIIRMFDQTWTFLGMHCTIASFSRVWKCAMSSRDKEVGSGRRRPAENEAFAMAS